MEKGKKVKFYWEEQDDEDKKQKYERSVLTGENRPINVPLLKLSLNFPKVNPLSGKISIKKNEKEIIAEVPVPGYEKDEVDVHVSPDSVRIRCEKNKKDSRKGEGVFFSMSSMSCMEKNFTLPDEVDDRNYKIKFSGDMLVITMQRAKKKKFSLF